MWAWWLPVWACHLKLNANSVWCVEKHPAHQLSVDQPHHTLRKSEIKPEIKQETCIKQSDQIYLILKGFSESTHNFSHHFIRFQSFFFSDRTFPQKKRKRKKSGYKKEKNERCKCDIFVWKIRVLSKICGAGSVKGCEGAAFKSTSPIIPPLKQQAQQTSSSLLCIYALQACKYQPM